VFGLQLDSINAFKRDERGSILPTFGIMGVVIVMCIGAGVDYARLHHSQSRLAAAADAASLAAGKALLDGRNSDADVKRIAVEYFQQNFSEHDGYARVQSVVARLDRVRNAVEVDIAADVPMTIMRMVGVEQVNLPVSSVSIFDQKDIEVALALDVTGSMCQPCTKIDALKDATNDLIDILLPDAGTPNKVRIGLAPYSSGVNAGSYASPATGNRSSNGCTFERFGSEPAGDQAPGTGNYLKASSDVGGAGCPAATVVGLSADKSVLQRTVDGYRTNGTTAGHLGAQWASYLVSPKWSGVFGGESAPAAYKDGKTVKAVILMTDGENNTFGGSQRGSNRTLSDTLTGEICSAMRNQDVMVFTVGFGTLDTTAQTLLKSCANDTSRFFMATNEAALRQAFTNIANQLNNLRLSK